MEKKTIVQKIKKEENNLFDKAFRYYNILFAINGLHLTEREIQLVAFAAIKGNISLPFIKQEFNNTFNSSSATINNIISKLKKLSILVKHSGKIKVNPLVVLDFEKDILLQVVIANKENEQNAG